MLGPRMTRKLDAAVGDRSPRGSSSMPTVHRDLVLEQVDTSMQLNLVLDRLDALGQQVEGMFSGQKVLQTVVEQIHMDVVQLPENLGKHVSAVEDHQTHESYALTPVGQISIGHVDRAPTARDCFADPSTNTLKSVLEQSSVSPSLGDVHDLRMKPILTNMRSDSEDSKQNEDSMKIKVQKRKELVQNRYNSGLGTKLSAPAYLVAFSSSEGDSVGPVTILGPRCRVQPLHPESWKRAIFDITTMMVLLYESIWIPYQFAWNVKLEGAFLVFSFLRAVFWTLDVVLGFGTGYRDQNQRLVMSFRDIACHYLKTTFWADFIVVVTDVSSIAGELNLSSQTSANSSTTVAIKFVRVIKLNRLLKLEAMFRTGRVALLLDYVVTYMRKRGLDEQFNFVTRIMKLIFVIIWVNHFGCCIWHRVGIEANNGVMCDFPELAGVPYLFGYFWSICAMIAGEAIVTPTNVGELVVTILVVLFGFIFSSIMISSLIAAVMDYGIANQERTLNLKTLRQFLCQHSVDSRLAMPIEKQANARMASARRLSQKDVSALSLISPTLRAELWADMYGPCMSTHPFIRTCNVLVPSFIKDVCFCALSHVAEESGKVIFEPHVEAVGARFVYWGSLNYIPLSAGCLSPTHSQALETTHAGAPAVQVVKGNWISEVALWAHWQHLGWMEASSPCELLTLRAETFLQVVLGHPDTLARIATDYSSALLKATEGEVHQEMVNDLLLAVQHQSIVPAMPLHARIGMSDAALQILDRQSHWNTRRGKNAFKDLQKEINTGECDMFIDENENVQRVVTIVAVRLEKEGGFVVAQIGKCQRGECSARCTYPGTKVRTGELPRDAIDRLVNGKLHPYKDGLIWGKIEVDQENRISKKFGLNSKYLRTVFHAKLQQGFVPVENTLPTKEQLMLTRGFTSRATIRGRVPSVRQAFTLGNMQTMDSTFVFAWLKPDDHFLLTNSNESDEILKRWISEVDLSEIEELSKSMMSNDGVELT